jgi:hypothetical protein
MLNANPQTILEVIATSLERMAFISIDPVDGPATLPAQPILVRVPLRLPEQGALEMIASRGFGALIATNAMAVGPDQPISIPDSDDALAEFLNILASALLVSSCVVVPAGEIVKGVPEVVMLTGEANWNDFIADPRAVLFSAEQHVVACRLTAESGVCQAHCSCQ